MMYANYMGYSDVDPYEVVKAVSKITLEIREMDAERDDSFKPNFVPGGFSAICTNQYDQKWDIKSNEKNPVIRIRLSKKKGWQDKYGRRFVLSEKPQKFYDYNF